MKPKRAKGRNWTDKETRLFIELCSEYQMLSIKDGRLQTNIPRFKIIEEKMKEAGYMQNSKQLAIKFKQLKQLYYRTTNEIQFGETNSRFNYYEEMNALVAAAGNGLINDSNDTSFNFDGDDDDDSREEIGHIDFQDAVVDETDVTFQFDNNIIKESDSLSNASDSNEENIRKTRSRVKRSYASSSNDDRPLIDIRTETKKAKGKIKEYTSHQSCAEEWYKQQSKLQQEFFEEQRKLLRSQKLLIHKQYFDEQLKLQKQQQEWMEKMIKEDRKHLNEQLKDMMNIFIEGVQKMNSSNMLSDTVRLTQNINLDNLQNEHSTVEMVEEHLDESTGMILAESVQNLPNGVVKQVYLNERNRGYRLTAPEI